MSSTQLCPHLRGPLAVLRSHLTSGLSLSGLVTARLTWTSCFPESLSCCSCCWRSLWELSAQSFSRSSTFVPWGSGWGWGVSVVRYPLLLPSQVALEAVLCPTPQNQESLKRALMAFFKRSFGRLTPALSALAGGRDICAGHRPGPVDISEHRAS